MAVFEDLRSDEHRGRALLAAVTQHPLETIRLALVVLLVALWLIAAYAGIVYWSLHGSLLGVMVSAVVPGLAAASTWGLYVRLGAQPIVEADEAGLQS